jgi:hypothetical protein
VVPARLAERKPAVLAQANVFDDTTASHLRWAAKAASGPAPRAFLPDRARLAGVLGQLTGDVTAARDGTAAARPEVRERADDLIRRLSAATATLAGAR